MKKVILRNKGGIGNQLFMYCAAKSIAINLNANLYIDNTTGFTNDYYRRSPGINYILNETLKEANGFEKLLIKIKNLASRNILKKLGISIIEENSIYNLVEIDYLELNNYDKILIEGYFQSYTYFERNEDKILKNIFQDYVLKENYIEYENSIINSNSVSIHVRRLQYDNLLELSYYKSAFAFIHSKMNNPTFFIFSDDIEWCIKNFSDYNCTYIISEKPNEFDELYLMSRCRHHIIANSSFSWWGARIIKDEHKIIIAPSKTQIGVKGFFYPPNWFIIK
jgi:Glycosyl transferase family 11